MKRASMLTLIMVMMLILQACNGDEKTTTAAGGETTETTELSETSASTAEETEPAPTALEIYDQMVEQLEAMDSMTLEISSVSTTTLGMESFEEKEKQTLVLQNIGTDSFTATLEGTVDWEYFWIDMTEVFVGDRMYFTVMANSQRPAVKYSAEMTAEEYLARTVPANMFDAQLYASVENPTTNTLTFTDPLGSEEWFGIGEGELISVEGRVYLAKDRMPERMTCEMTYRQGSAEIQRVVTIAISPDTSAPIIAPEKPEEYQVLEGAAIYGPYLQVHALGYLAQTDIYSSLLRNSAMSEAGGCSYEEQVQIDLFADEELVQARKDGRVQLVDLQTGEYYFDDTYEENYQDGKYESRYNGELTDSGEYSYTDYFNHLFENTFGIIQFPTFTESYQVGNYGGTILVEYEMPESYGTEMATEVAGLMFAEAETLDKLASAYRTELIRGYIGIDAATGIPTVVGTDYVGVHTIDGYDYQLSYSVMANLLVGHESTYEALTGEMLEVSEEIAEVTPLFYRVTGDQGQEMWLLGTIHVGDRRTSNLPKEIEEAFAAADALAVEFDVDAFEEQLLIDPELAEQVASLYYYMDGTTAQDHISDPELYAYALRRLLAAGMLDNAMLLCKPAIWSQFIDEYLMRWNYDLSSENGMDLRLLEMAREQGKTILDVESGMEQIKMLTDFSGELQEMLLGSSLMTTPVSYVTQVNEMYELWCAGDEKALTAYLNGEELPEMTEEEKALYEEYMRAISTDRDIDMLQTAKEYLESGDVVFYAVGLAHLLAEDGLVNELREAGYTVELVTYQK